METHWYVLIGLLFLALFAFTVAFLTHCYTLLYNKQKEATERSQMALLASIYAGFQARENMGVVNLLKEAPTLRQYIERYVPVTKGEDAERSMRTQMQQFEKDWSAVFGLGDTQVKPEDTV